MLNQINCMVLVQGLVKQVGDPEQPLQILRGIDLLVSPGEFVAIMGPSGSGKSTLLHLLAGLDVPTAGTIQIGDQDISRMTDKARILMRGKMIGLIFQDFQLLDMLTAEENVALPLVIAGYRRRQVQPRAVRMLEIVGLKERSSHFPHQLSGGEQQRVAIARALIINPVLLLADEPTGNLDSANSEHVMQLLRNLANQRRHTIIMVTHDAQQARVADRIVEMRDGTIIAQKVNGTVPQNNLTLHRGS